MKTTKFIMIICIVQIISGYLNEGHTQVPQSTNYQGVARNAQGNPLVNQIISLRFTLTNGNNGPVLYKETWQDTTNQFGLFSVKIGAGNVVSGNFSGINWGNVTPYLEVEMDVNGSTNYVDMGSSPWVSVPYALHSNSTGAINGTQNFVAKFTPNGSAIGNSLLFDDGTNVGIGTSTPNDKLDVVGNGQFSGYLKVGNPSVPSVTSSNSPIPLYKLSYSSGSEAWSQDNYCGNETWFIDTSGADAGQIFFNAVGSYNRGNQYSPWIWLPTGSSNLIVEGTFSCYLENGYDGVFLEYKSDNSSWIKISNFEFGGYSSNANGCNTSCVGSDYQSSWTGINNTRCFRVNSSVFTSSVFGKWIRFRFVGMEDGSAVTGNFNLLGFNVTAFGGTNIGGAFSGGNIYAEKNIYAGSNVLIGDVAEYFTVVGNSEPGDLISLVPDNPEVFSVCKTAYDGNLVGIHSSNPTVTLNVPNGVPVSLTGRVYVNVNTEGGPIRIGDYLTSSSAQGQAMKAARPCFIVGRALENYSGKDKGKILCMVETGWYNRSVPTTKQTGGNAILETNSKKVIINDPSVSESSRIFITFQGNVGGYWISEIRDGEFTVSLERSSGAPVKFDYFVDNARNSVFNSVHNSLTEAESGSNTNTVLYKKEGSESKPENRPGVPVRLYEDAEDIAPGTPEDPSIGWIYTHRKGMTKSDVAVKNQ